MTNRNASDSAFGWDFQTNAAIILLIDNIKEMKAIKIEGKSEDIEVILANNQKIYAQVKSVTHVSSTSNLRKKLIDALTSLNDASINKDGMLFTYITNSPNPFNDKTSMIALHNSHHLYYDELPVSASNKINNIISSQKLNYLPLNKLDIRIIQFIGKDLNNRYSFIRNYVSNFLSKIDPTTAVLADKLLEIWQLDFFHNCTLEYTSLSIKKEDLLKPVIVLLLDMIAASDYKKTFNDDDIAYLDKHYHNIINQKTLDYSLISKIYTDYLKSKETIKNFTINNWHKYKYILEDSSILEEMMEPLLKIILHKILMQKNYLKKIGDETNHVF